MINSIVGLIVGAFLGGLMTLMIRRRKSILLLNIIGGSIGGFVASYLVSPLLGIDTTSFSVPGLFVSLIGAVVLPLLINFFIREHTVSNAVLEERWDQIRDQIHTRWNKLSEADVEKINGKHDLFIELIQERYELSKEEAEKQLQGYLRAITKGP